MGILDPQRKIGGVASGDESYAWLLKWVLGLYRLDRPRTRVPLNVNDPQWTGTVYSANCYGEHFAKVIP